MQTYIACFVLIFGFWKPVYSSDCVPALSLVGQSVFTLSDYLSVANKAQESCKQQGGSLAITRETQASQTVADAAALKYIAVKDAQRLWIFYDSRHPELDGNSSDLYKYSLTPNVEPSHWTSPEHLDQMWYLNLYNSSASVASSTALIFCKAVVNPSEKWSLELGAGTCSPGWNNTFTLYATAYETRGFKQILTFGGPGYSDRLTDVNETYRTSTNFRGDFYAPVSEVFIGARFDVNTTQWKWSDGEIATEFTDVNYTTCQQKVWDIYEGKELNKNCNQSQAFYSCQIDANFETSNECNSTTLVVSWNLLRLTTYYARNLTVVIELRNASHTETFTVVNGDYKSVHDLTRLGEYEVSVRADIGCTDLPEITYFKKIVIAPGQPNDVINAHVIKSSGQCNVTVANPLPMGEFDLDISVHNDTGRLDNFTHTSDGEYCSQDICMIPIQLSDYTGSGKLSFTISASNCEGTTLTRSVAGTCIAPNLNVQPDCSPTLTSQGDSVLSLSDEIADPTESSSNCSSLGGALASFNETSLNKEVYPILSEQYTEDIQRVWIYRLKTNNQVYKYSFSNTTDNNWEAPTENDHLTYLDLYNRYESERDAIYFCKSENNPDNWQVDLQNCNGEGYAIQIFLYGRIFPADGYKRVYIFKSTSTNSTKLTTNNITDASFDYHGEFYIPDINVRVAEITRSTNTLCPMLHYGESWETLTNCSEKSAYYACSVPFISAVESIECDSSRLIVTWEENLFGLKKQIPDFNVIKVVISGESGETSIQETEAEYSELTATIDNLPQRKTVTIKIEVLFEGCSIEPVYSTLIGETSYGLEDPVKNARVEETTTTAVCTVVLPPDEHGHLLTYRVKATSNANVTYHDYELTTTESEEELKMNISMEPHGSNQRVDLMIQAFTCEGPNEWELVEGFCTSPGEQTSGVSVGVIVGSVCGAVAFLALCTGGFLYYKKRKPSKAVYKNETKLPSPEDNQSENVKASPL